MTDDEIKDLGDQIKDNSGYGYVTKSGRTGRIVSLDTVEGVLEIDTPMGARSALVDDTTIVKKTMGDATEDMNLAKLSEGMLVMVSGPMDAKGKNVATSIEVVPEGADGFKIAPVTGDSPASVPIFP